MEPKIQRPTNSQLIWLGILLIAYSVFIGAFAHREVDAATTGYLPQKGDPCQLNIRNIAPINLTASGRIFQGTAGKQTYICHVELMTAAAQNIALVEGSGTVCASTPLALTGGNTAATGWQFAANGGIVSGHDGYFAYKTATAGDDVCVLLSGAGQTSGSISYVQQ